MKSKIILLAILILALPAQAQTSPEKFQNPIFNDVLWASNKRTSRDLKITPEKVTELESLYDSECEYVSEDNKGILLKCLPVSMGFDKDFVVYHMYYVRYKYNKSCSIWWCPFKITNGKITPLGMGTPAAYSSKIFNCEDEEEEVHDPSIPYEAMNCIEELKARGWDKYLPGSLPDEKTRLY